MEEVVDDRESEDEEPSTSKEDSPPSYDKKDDIVAAIRRMTVEQTWSSWQERVFKASNADGQAVDYRSRKERNVHTSNLCDQYEDSFSILK